MADTTLLFFILTSLLIILSPGQDMVLLLSRSIAQGSKAGVITAAGVGTGLLGHTVLAALGLGALLQASELAFTIMKYAGAAYLLYLGIKTLLSASKQLDITSPTRDSSIRLFAQGALSNISNPKIAIFYFAYLPQFVTTDSSQPTEALLLLGLTFALLTFVVKIPIGYFAGRLSRWIQAKPTSLAWLNRCCGGVLVSMGLHLMTENQSRG